MTTDVQGFVADLQRIERDVPLVVRDLHAGALGDAYETAVRRTPVDTGALRAENVLLSAGALIFEPAGRVGPDRRIPSTPGGPSIAEPNVSQARAALQTVEPFQLDTILNQRFYASFVHDGTDQAAPRPWLAAAQDTYEQSIRRLSVRDDPRLR